MKGLVLSRKGLSFLADAKRWIEVETINIISAIYFIIFMLAPTFFAIQQLKTGINDIIQTDEEKRFAV